MKRLFLLYSQESLIDKNNLYTATIAIGFVAQTVIMSLILFR
jgi:hypothetical protein